MGGNISNKRIYYEDIDSEQKTALVDKFKAIYSDKNIKEIAVIRYEFKPYYHYFVMDNIIMCFRYEPNLIDFVCELNRPFVFADIELSGDFRLRFVYGLKDIKV